MALTGQPTCILPTSRREREVGILSGERPSWKGEFQMKLGISIAALVLLGTACGVVPDLASSGGERVQRSAQAVVDADPSGGDGDGSTTEASLDRLVHPTPGEPTGNPCGPSRCGVGEFCCNESCGLCAPRGGICLQRQCGATPQALTECTDDSACRAISSYCDGCQCLAVGVMDPAPSCHAVVVACIVDPCHHQHPACVNGTCAILHD
jgi:hypothetical protein